MSVSEESERDSDGTELAEEGVVDNDKTKGRVVILKAVELCARAGFPIGECTAGDIEQNGPMFNRASYECTNCTWETKKESIIAGRVGSSCIVRGAAFSFINGKGMADIWWLVT